MTAIMSFGWKQYRVRRRIHPYEIEMLDLIKINRWDEVAKLCHTVLEIAPLYDHIGDRYSEAQEKSRQQIQQLNFLYSEAKSAILHKNWIEAHYKLVEIRQIRDDYKDVQNLITKAEFEHKKENEINNLSREANHANLQGDLRSAIESYRQILKRDPDNLEATQALKELQKAIEFYGTERLTPDTFKGLAMMARLSINDSYVVSHTRTNWR
jgi:tetratricopeptide (TPR) repeat protein